MNRKILIIGSTGKLGSSLINYCSKNNLKINAITCYRNNKKIKSLQIKHNIKNTFCLINPLEEFKFIQFLKVNKFKIIYFLDYGAFSIKYLDTIIKNNTNSTLAIANKEMLIAGGRIMIRRIYKTGNSLIPLDSEHFSLLNSKFNNQDIKKLYITASGGPFYFKKKTDLNKVSLSQVLNHPKWSMGVNNSIDSSNFINKILELLELSIIFDIDVKKTSFLISKEAFIHSVVMYSDNTISLNCFNNNMLLTLIKPLTSILKSKDLNQNSKKLFNIKNFKIEPFNDKRFKISKYLKKLTNLSHKEQINFMILNNLAHKKYLDGLINYNDIIEFIMKRLFINYSNIKLNTINDILRYINIVNKNYDY